VFAYFSTSVVLKHLFMSSDYETRFLLFLWCIVISSSPGLCVYRAFVIVHWRLADNMQQNFKISCLRAHT
jgi:hypothetical protein